MHVTKNIVRDLFPAYLAGEASGETRAVVEKYLARDAELRHIVEAARSFSLPPLETPENMESRSLRRTRMLFGRRNFWLGFALIFCLAAPILKPLWLADFAILIGLAGWRPFLIACRKLKATGLHAPRGWGPRLLWSACGGLLGVTVGLLLERHFGRGWRWQPLFNLFISGFLSAALIGENLRRIQTAAELRPPYPATLFGKTGPR